jgi:hypothetical protein
LYGNTGKNRLLIAPQITQKREIIVLRVYGRKLQIFAAQVYECKRRKVSNARNAE